MSSEKSVWKLASSPPLPQGHRSWYNPCRKQFGMKYGEPSKDSYPLTHSTSGILFQENNSKKEESYS
jgi:hypothetical protein